MGEKPASPDTLRSELRRAGLRATQARIQVLGFMRRRHGPISHSALVAALSPQGVDEVTVYRNLTDLCDAGLLRRLGSSGSYAYESLSDHSAEHLAHFLCTDCGNLLCLPDLDKKAFGRGKLPRALARGEYQVQVLGQCDACA